MHGYHNIKFAINIVLEFCQKVPLVRDKKIALFIRCTQSCQSSTTEDATYLINL